MRGFTRRVELPGLLTFALAMAIAYPLGLAHIRPEAIFLANGLLPVPVAWLCLLPICGALGAVVSSRNGGSRLDRMIAASFPAAIYCLVVLLSFIGGWVISLFVPGYGWNWMVVLPGLAWWMCVYVVLLEVALLLGAAVAEQIRKVARRTA